MATRRKYKSGGVAVGSDAAIIPDASPMASPPAEPVPPAAEPEPENQLLQQIAAHARAEQLQRQHAPPQQAMPTHEQQVAAHIDGLPISEFKKAFLRQYPQLLVEPFHHSMAHHYQLALHAGVPDDTPAMNQAILDGVQRDVEHHRALTSPDARPTDENRRAHHETNVAVEELTREAAEHLAEVAGNQTAAVMPQIRRNIPMSAPVSREVPGLSNGGRTTPITLSLEERQIANVSFRHLPQHAREAAYAKNKRKMIQMKADGRIQDGGR